MKLQKFLFVMLSVVALGSCEPLPPEIQPFYVEEPAIIIFYNNGDSTLERMSLNETLYYPVEDWTSIGDFYKEKYLSELSWDRLHPVDSIYSHSAWDCYIGCIRYAKFAVYYKDTTASDGYRLRGQYIVNDTIRQKYEIGAHKYPDKTTLVVNWPEDSVLFKLP